MYSDPVPLSQTIFQSGRLIQVKKIETALQDLAKGDRDRLIEVKITVIKGSNFRDFDNWPLNRRWPLNTGLLNTGSTVVIEAVLDKE